MEEVNIFKIILNVIGILVLISVIYILIWIYQNVYNPQKQSLVKGANYAVDEIQKVTSEIYKNDRAVYKNKTQITDEVCKILLEKNPLKSGSCVISKAGMLERNFTFDKTKIEVYGFEKPLIELDKVLVKEILIDVNGEEEGENLIGVDRIPVRIYSTGRMGGMVVPVNCNRNDEKDYGLIRSSLCAESNENFLETNVPFGYDIMQIGGDSGRTIAINNDIPLLRADCTAFGGDMLMLDDYCELKQLYWLKACYEDYTCALQKNKKK